MRLARALASTWDLPAVQDMGKREFRPEQTNSREPIRSEAAPDAQELLVALPADRLRAHAGKFAVGIGDGIARALEDRGRIAVRPPTGSVMMTSITPSPLRSWAVTFMLVAASMARAASRHRIDAAASGEATV